MKSNRVFRWLFIALVLTTVMLVSQSCGSLFEDEMHRIFSSEETEVDTVPSEDLEFWGLNNEDWQSADDPIVE